uniref:Uncharacterized protein n=1 Tax=Siphoviridae sp. ctVf96 TaxID=2827882 RepID=A0A8S5TD74_9CAUD|nr:MAG TPA: hypothetical protein [Siphoviridae sp. ctVf96]
MQIVLTKSDVDALAKRIVEYLWEAIPTEAIPDPPKKEKAVTAEKEAEPVKTAEPVKEEAAAKQEETAYTLEEVIKAVKEYTLKDKEGAMKLKPILQSLGAEKLSLLPKEKLPEFIEGARKVGVEI